MSKTSEREPMSAQDALWLEMDRPSNLMVIDSLMWTTEPIDWDRFNAVANDRLWDRYRVFRSTAVHEDGTWRWEERPADSFESHVVASDLAEPGGDAELQAFVASQRTTPLDRSRPLWILFCIDDFHGGSAMLARTHHAIADGIRMVQLAMSLFDAAPDGGAILAPSPYRADPAVRAARPLAERVRADVGAAAQELADLAGSVGGTVGRAVGDPARTIRIETRSTGRRRQRAGRPRRPNRELAANSDQPDRRARRGIGDRHEGAFHRCAAAARDQPSLPGDGPLVDLLSSSPGDVDVARKLLLGTRNDPTYWTGSVGTRKVVAWSEPLPLAEVKDVARAHEATVNDVLVTCVAGTLHAYLTAHDSTCATTKWMVPVNLKPLDHTLPEQLGNEFAVVQLELPTGTADPLAVLDAVKRRMGRIKNGHEAGVAFRLQELISGFNDQLYRASVDLLANRAVGVLTNVAGAPIPVYLAGRRVEGMVGWAPLSGNQPMSFTIYSYDGKVFVGIACDAGLVPDHDQIVDGFAAAFHRLAVAVR